MVQTCAIQNQGLDIHSESDTDAQTLRVTQADTNREYTYTYTHTVFRVVVSIDPLSLS